MRTESNGFRKVEWWVNSEWGMRKSELKIEDLESISGPGISDLHHVFFSSNPSR